MIRLFDYIFVLLLLPGSFCAPAEPSAANEDSEGGTAALPIHRSRLQKRHEEDPNGQYVQLIKHPSCENMTQSEFLTIFAQYPNVRVRCEAEQTILSPSELIDFGRDLTYDLEVSTVNKGVYSLIESSTQHEIDRVYIRFPIGPCVRPTQPGTGQIEMFMTFNALTKRMKEVSGEVPIIDMRAGRAQASTKAREFIYSTLCTYRDMGVRPVMELFTQITQFQTRKWAVDPGQHGAVTKSKWRNITAAELSEATLAVACVSERYVPNICQWTEVDAMAELTEYFTKRQQGHGQSEIKGTMSDSDYI